MKEKEKDSVPTLRYSRSPSHFGPFLARLSAVIAIVSFVAIAVARQFDYDLGRNMMIVALGLSVSATVLGVVSLMQVSVTWKSGRGAAIFAVVVSGIPTIIFVIGVLLSFM